MNWARNFAGYASLIILIGISQILGTRAASAAGRESSGGWLSPTALVASPDGETLYIACATADRVLAFDLATGRVVKTIKVSGSPNGLALSADGRRSFVTSGSPDSQVCVVDTARGKVVDKISAGHTAMSPVLSPDAPSDTSMPAGVTSTRTAVAKSPPTIVPDPLAPVYINDRQAQSSCPRRGPQT